MAIEIAKFIPSELRREVTLRLIEEKGIRPLAREIGVNPKSVYKYKEGTANPGDEVFSKVLALTQKEDSMFLNEYLEKIESQFLDALGSEIDPDKILTQSYEDAKGGKEVKDEGEEESSVDSRTTEESVEESAVVEGPTLEQVSTDEIFDRVGVSDPFKRTKLEKIVGAINLASEVNLPELVEQTGLSTEAVEKYLDMLLSEEIIRRNSSGGYQFSEEFFRSS